MTEASAAPDRADLEQSTAALLATVDAVARELHAGRTDQPAATLDSALDADLALDSLSRVELGARLERAFDVSLREQAVFDAATPRDLLRAVMKARAGAPLLLHTAVAADHVPRDIDEPREAGTLADMLEWHVDRHGDAAHIQLYDDFSDGEVISYRALYHGATRVAGALEAHGLVPGETVALMLPTGRDYFETFYGVILAGGVPVPIYPPLRRQQLEDHLRRQSRILANCGAVMLVTTAEARAVAHLLTAAVSSLRHVLATGALGDGEFERAARRPEDTAFLQYTSGSTGDPKGVILSHANLLANVRADGRGMGARPDDVFVSWLPLYHDMGLIGAWLGSLYHGVRLVVMPPLAFLSRPERWLWAIHRYGGTLSAAPNFAYELCLKRIGDEAIDGLDLSGWRIAANGAEAISARTLDAFCARFGAYGFRREAMFPVYGLAECSVGLAFTPLGRGPLVEHVRRAALAERGIAEPVDADAEEDSIALVGCGQPLPGHEIRVVDRAGRELPERHEGVLEFRGPSATSGYHNRPDATAALFRDGWLNTGDRAYIAAGELFVTGRVKDLIIRAGRNIYPAELEDAIGNLDGIRKGHVAIFGSADEAGGTERLVVLAETRRRSAEGRAALKRAINELATDLVTAPPDEIVLAPPNTVLRTSSGKIRRSACRMLYEQGHIGESGSAVWLQVARLVLAGILPQLRRASRASRDRLYAGWAWLSFGTLALAAFVVASLPLPRGWVWHGVRAAARVALVATCNRTRLRGRENLPPPGTGCVLVSNHQSYLDGILMLALLPRQARFLIKADLAGAAVVRRPLERLGCLFVERFDAGAGIAGMQEAADALAAGDALMIFPEGTFKRMPGLLPFHMGAFTTAATAGVPVVPVALAGTRSMLRAGSWFPRRGRVTLDLGAAVAPADAGWQAALALRDAARAHILACCGEPDLAH
ncbi:MAG: AMP-binding protein, partial [Gammaproteobacteria bacterium]